MPYEIHILKSAQRSLVKIAAREQARIILKNAVEWPWIMKRFMDCVLTRLTFITRRVNQMLPRHGERSEAI